MTLTANKALYVNEDGEIQVRNDINHEEIAAGELVI